MNVDEQERILMEDETEPAAQEDIRTETEDAQARMAGLARRLEACAALLVLAEARCAAALMGVKDARLDCVARLADLQGIDPEDGEMRAKVALAVKAVLGDVPELLSGAGTGGAMAARRPRRDAFARGFIGE